MIFLPHMCCCGLYFNPHFSLVGEYLTMDEIFSFLIVRNSGKLICDY
jgi:hypothetical protein